MSCHVIPPVVMYCGLFYFQPDAGATSGRQLEGEGEERTGEGEEGTVEEASGGAVYDEDQVSQISSVRLALLK